MCGIVVSSLDIPDDALKLVQKRGPDLTNRITYEGIHFIHFLLQITGETTPQPLIEDGIVVIFNGEIYNYKDIYSDAKSDSYSILHAYQKHKEKFIQFLDGDFVVVIFDFNTRKIYISSDIFGTKPIYYSIKPDHIVISSYPTPMRKIRSDIIPKENRYNQILTFDLDKRSLLEEKDIHRFDLRQHKDNYVDFNSALEKAILKRYPENSIPLLNLSSGMDSGTIACVLSKFDKEAIYVVFSRGEDKTILDLRKDKIKGKIIFMELTQKDKVIYEKNLKKNCELFVWDWRWNQNVREIHEGFKQGSMLAKSKTFDHIKSMDNSVKVCYSGIGADEIMSKSENYSCGIGNPDSYPEDLSVIFPWKNFFEGCMKNYIKGDEYVGGCYSFETRFPFCDKYLVQEFLWLKPELKDKHKKFNHKAPLAQYLEKEGFPFHVKKLGFDV